MQNRAIRWLWLAAGVLSLVLGAIGVALPVFPTVPFVILAAYCFARGSKRWENWLLNHPTMGPMVRNWRDHHAVPLRAKQVSTVTMAISSALSWWFMPPRIGWIPAACCTAIAIWLWCQPSTPPAGSASDTGGPRAT